VAQKHAEVHVKGFVFANRIDYVLECYFSSLSSITEKKKLNIEEKKGMEKAHFFIKRSLTYRNGPYSCLSYSACRFYNSSFKCRLRSFKDLV